MHAPLVVAAIVLMLAAPTAAMAEEDRDPAYGIAAERLTTTPGNTPHATELAVDFNGDGRLSRDEVKPGSNLALRFDRRDANHDGYLTQDEYFMPPGSGANAGAAPAWWHPD